MEFFAQTGAVRQLFWLGYRPSKANFANIFTKSQEKIK